MVIAHGCATAMEEAAAKVEDYEERQELQREILERAKQGDVDAQYRLGVFAPNSAEGWKWLCAAANQNHVDAQAEMGLRYRDGIEPAAQDNVRAYMWFSIAKNNGDIWAAARRRNLAAAMTSS